MAFYLVACSISVLLILISMDEEMGSYMGNVFLRWKVYSLSGHQKTVFSHVESKDSDPENWVLRHHFERWDKHCYSGLVGTSSLLVNTNAAARRF